MRLEESPLQLKASSILVRCFWGQCKFLMSNRSTFRFRMSFVWRRRGSHRLCAKWHETTGAVRFIAPAVTAIARIRFFQ